MGPLTSQCLLGEPIGDAHAVGSGHPRITQQHVVDVRHGVPVILVGDVLGLGIELLPGKVFQIAVDYSVVNRVEVEEIALGFAFGVADRRRDAQPV